jgi:hypothetical protein
VAVVVVVPQIMELAVLVRMLKMLMPGMLLICLLQLHIMIMRGMLNSKQPAKSSAAVMTAAGLLHMLLHGGAAA